MWGGGKPSTWKLHYKFREKDANPLLLKEGGVVNRRSQKQMKGKEGVMCTPLCEEVNGDKSILNTSILRCC